MKILLLSDAKEAIEAIKKVGSDTLIECDFGEKTTENFGYVCELLDTLYSMLEISGVEVEYIEEGEKTTNE